MNNAAKALLSVIAGGLQGYGQGMMARQQIDEEKEQVQKQRDQNKQDRLDEIALQHQLKIYSDPDQDHKTRMAAYEWLKPKIDLPEPAKTGIASRALNQFFRTSQGGQKQIMESIFGPTQKAVDPVDQFRMNWIKQYNVDPYGYHGQNTNGREKELLDGMANFRKEMQKFYMEQGPQKMVEEYPNFQAMYENLRQQLAEYGHKYPPLEDFQYTEDNLVFPDKTVTTKKKKTIEGF